MVAVVTGLGCMVAVVMGLGCMVAVVTGLVCMVAVVMGLVSTCDGVGTKSLCLYFMFVCLFVFLLCLSFLSSFLSFLDLSDSRFPYLIYHFLSHALSLVSPTAFLSFSL